MGIYIIQFLVGVRLQRMTLAPTIVPDAVLILTIAEMIRSITRG